MYNLRLRSPESAITAHCPVPKKALRPSKAVSIHIGPKSDFYPLGTVGATQRSDLLRTRSGGWFYIFYDAADVSASYGVSIEPKSALALLGAHGASVESLLATRSHPLAVLATQRTRPKVAVPEVTTPIDIELAASATPLERAVARKVMQELLPQIMPRLMKEMLPELIEQLTPRVSRAIQNHLGLARGTVG